MAWKLTISRPEVGEVIPFDDVSIECTASDETNFGILTARKSTNGEFIGGIALHHSIEFSPTTLDARGFAVDENRKLTESQTREMWKMTVIS